MRFSKQCFISTTHGEKETLPTIWFFCLLCCFNTLVSIWASNWYFMQLWKSNDWCRGLEVIIMWVPFPMLTWAWACCLPFSLTPYGGVQGGWAWGQVVLSLPRTSSRAWWGGLRPGWAGPGESEWCGFPGLVPEKLEILQAGAVNTQSYSCYQ